MLTKITGFMDSLRGGDDEAAPAAADEEPLNSEVPQAIDTSSYTEGKRWCVGREHAVIVRETMELDSPEVAKLETSQLVKQTAPFSLLDTGIVRMKMFPIDMNGNSAGPEGWVTFDARKLNGPLFFEDVVDDDGFFSICDIDEKTYGVRVLLAVRMEMARAVREGEDKGDPPDSLKHLKRFNGVIPWFMLGVGGSGAEKASALRNERPAGFEDDPIPNQRTYDKGAGKSKQDDVQDALATLSAHLGVQGEELLAKLKDLKGGSSDNPISRPHGYDAPAPQWKPKPERDTPKPDAKEIQWQVRPGKTVDINRKVDLDSQVIGKMKEGERFWQAGKGTRLPNGVVRMPISSPIKGWITVTDYAAGGENYVEPVVDPQAQRAASRSSPPAQSEKGFPMWTAVFDGEIVLRQSSELKSPTLKAEVVFGESYQQISPVQRLKVEGANLSLDRLHIDVKGVKGWATVDARHGGGPLYFKKNDLQGGPAFMSDMDRNLNTFYFSVGKKFIVDTDKPQAVTPTDALGQQPVTTIPKGTIVTQEHFPKVVEGSIRIPVKPEGGGKSSWSGWATVLDANTSVPNFLCECAAPKVGTKWRPKDRKVLAREKITLDSLKAFELDLGAGFIEQTGSAVPVGAMLRMPVTNEKGARGWVTVFAIDQKGSENNTVVLERDDYAGVPEWGREPDEFRPVPFAFGDNGGGAPPRPIVRDESKGKGKRGKDFDEDKGKGKGKDFNDDRRKGKGKDFDEDKGRGKGKGKRGNDENGKGKNGKGDSGWGDNGNPGNWGDSNRKSEGTWGSGSGSGAGWGSGGSSWGKKEDTWEKKDNWDNWDKKDNWEKKDTWAKKDSGGNDDGSKSWGASDSSWKKSSKDEKDPWGTGERRERKEGSGAWAKALTSHVKKAADSKPAKPTATEAKAPEQTDDDWGNEWGASADKEK
jgi:hypothetical protein